MEHLFDLYMPYRNWKEDFDALAKAEVLLQCFRANQMQFQRYPCRKPWLLTTSTTLPSYALSSWVSPPPSSPLRCSTSGRGGGRSEKETPAKTTLRPMEKDGWFRSWVLHRMDKTAQKEAFYCQAIYYNLFDLLTSTTHHAPKEIQNMRVSLPGRKKARF